jgi:hypothetical protein
MNERNSGKKWSGADEAKLKQMASVFTTKQIANKLGRSEGAIRGKASQLDISVNPDDRVM